MQKKNIKNAKNFYECVKKKYIYKKCKKFLRRQDIIYDAKNFCGHEKRYC